MVRRETLTFSPFFLLHFLSLRKGGAWAGLAPSVHLQTEVLRPLAVAVGYCAVDRLIKTAFRAANLRMVYATIPGETLTLVQRGRLCIDGLDPACILNRILFLHPDAWSGRLCRRVASIGAPT